MSKFFLPGVNGYLYAPNQGISPMSGAQSGATVGIAGRRPPWLVVNYNLESLIVSQWPGRLWRVEVIEPVTDADVLDAGGGWPSKSAQYIRAVSVRVIEEVPVSQLFGLHGEAVCRVIAAAGQLTLEQIRVLAATRHPDADRVYSRAWNTWLTGVREGRRGSPVNCGFSVLSSEVTKRARVLTGELAFFTDEEGQIQLEPTWQAASSTLLHAAMVFGAPGLCAPHDSSVLAAGWRSVMGDDPIS
jgi:hypothetical protein